MTQKFLDIFFLGRWHNYGHWSAVLMMALAGDLFMHWALSAAISIAVGALWEFIQWIWDSGWNWTDILYNFAGACTFLLIKVAEFVFLNYIMIGY